MCLSFSGGDFSMGIYGRNFQPSNLPVSALSHVYYAFMNIHANGTVFSGDTYADLEKHYPGDSWNDPGANAYGCVNQLYQLKKKNRHLKSILSIGGATWSANYPAAASSDATRKAFSQSAVGFMKDWGFDGIDIDWEYPASEAEANDLTLLLQALRQELDMYSTQHGSGHHFLLSMAAPANPVHISKLNIKEISHIVDYINLMAYDYSGSWDKVTGYVANIGFKSTNMNATRFATETALKAYVDGGAPVSKIVLGLPTYGRAFEQTDGIGMPFTGIGQGIWEEGVWDYKVLPKQNAHVFCDYEVRGCYSFDPKAKELISFDTSQIVSSKVAWLRREGLAGSIFWEASGDRSDEDSLIATSYHALSAIDDSSNQLEYPDSMYDNIRAA
ncbi:chitinase [Akanthomyces lecanii RCEF 1005]|uniref:chitinase n=1 Tax=Akanthomyces lecanii RCEF 1005 TaxID=1081108 RepID=A0A167XM25_CORDF|nr:chitinase [Akanthomyces lecanii RCEF 1005]